MSVRSIVSLALQVADTERAACSLARDAGSFLARAGDVAGHLREDSLYLGRVSLGEVTALDPVQFLAFQACRAMVHFPVYGESMVRAALQSASDACYAAASVLYRRRIAQDSEPLAVTQAGIDREQAPQGLTRLAPFAIEHGGAWSTFRGTTGN